MGIPPFKCRKCEAPLFKPGLCDACSKPPDVADDTEKSLTDRHSEIAAGLAGVRDHLMDNGFTREESIQLIIGCADLW